VPRLAEAIQDKDMTVRQTALGALGQIGPSAREAATAVAGLARDANPTIRYQALFALERIGPDQEVAREVAVAGLKDDTPMVRAQAATLLWAADPRHPGILDHAVALSRDPQSRFLGLNLLGRMGPAADKAVPALVQMFRQERDPNLRRHIAATLGQIGPGAREAADELVGLLKEQDLNARQVALTALQSIGGGEPRTLVPALLDLLREDRGFTRAAALDLLGEQGRAAREAVPVLLEELRRPQWMNHVQAARALGRIDPERARKEGVPLLEKWLRAPAYRLQAAQALCFVDPGHKEAMAALRGALKGKEPGLWFTRQQAADLVGALGAAGRPATPELREALRDPAPVVRLSAAAALCRVSADPEAGLPLLLDSLDASQPGPQRYTAVHKLMEMGPVAKGAVPALLDLRADPDQHLRALVANALRKIDPAAASRAGLP
jgi:HEAT repeat protein